MALTKQSDIATKEVRLKKVSAQLISELENIAANNGTTVSQFLRTKLRDIVNSYPSEMRFGTIRQAN